MQIVLSRMRPPAGALRRHISHLAGLKSTGQLVSRVRPVVERVGRAARGQNPCYRRFGARLRDGWYAIYYGHNARHRAASRS
jgi:hypothetical protein